jgi:hypothetical protein
MVIIACVVCEPEKSLPVMVNWKLSGCMLVGVRIARCEVPGLLTVGSLNLALTPTGKPLAFS